MFADHLPIVIRQATPDDAVACGDILYRAFYDINSRNGRPPDFPSPEFGAEMMRDLIATPTNYVVVATTADGTILGSNCLWFGDSVAGIGPTFVEPNVQNTAVGKQLMQAVISHAEERQVASIRLVQTTFNSQSLALYSKQGFAVREPLANLQGAPVHAELPGRRVRPVGNDDIVHCLRLHTQVHGFARAAELTAAIEGGAARLVEYNGQITGYTTGIGFFGYAVAYSNDDLKALIGASEAFGSGGFYVPLRNTELYTWCLGQGLRITSVETLMTRGLYSEPAGAWLPSALY